MHSAETLHDSDHSSSSYPRIVSPYAIYARQLLPLGFGMPLWNPEQGTDSGDVFIGDVGFLEDGGFHRVFNARLPLSHTLNRAHGTPYALPLQEGVEHPKHERTAVGSGVMCSEGISRGSGSSIKGNWLEAEQQFLCRKQTGAILVQEGTTRYELPADSSRIIGSYMLHHYSHWHRFATASLHRAIPRGDLLLVRGCTQCTDWAMTAFWDQRDPSNTVKLSFQAGRHEGYPSIALRMPSDPLVKLYHNSRANSSMVSDELPPGTRWPAPKWSESQETLVPPKPRYATFINYYKFRWRRSERPDVGPEEHLSELYDPVDSVLDYILRVSWWQRRSLQIARYKCE
ncbi:hypothetical protein OBBRIDRAFT_792365 [Obba rivulosa]|uniref:Uncharacterized protein n=1 Tax=Obba rivulosa TaxID=1052685 RepID=A0A8E2DL93_9APHY|nr:hypothetical protein OBBRIDRAFT_792365 [Obba rivulosa]